MNRSDQELRPAKRSLGQNFLVDPNYIRKIVDSLELSASDTVVEIGSGRGAITEHLVESGAKVVAVELDREFVPMLREAFAENDNFSINEADATKVNFEELIVANSRSAIRDPHSTKLVANLPYYISTPILQHLSTQRHLFESLVLMFQKEVVDRITAKPGNSGRGFLTVLAEGAFHVEKLFDVPPTAFRPVPKVTSSVARFVPKPQLIDDEEAFRDLISIAFAQKRKTILNNLKVTYSDVKEKIERSGIDPQRRAESLHLSEWVSLFASLR